MKYLVRAAAVLGVMLGVIGAASPASAQMAASPASAQMAASAAGAQSAASAAGTQIAGPWVVTGKVGGFGFTLNCQFETQGTHLAGVCTDASTNDPKVKAGKAHPLTAGSVTGNNVTWTYQSSFLLAKFNVTYTGVLNGNEMTGTIVAAGRNGNFSAKRK